MTSEYTSANIESFNIATINNRLIAPTTTIGTLLVDGTSKIEYQNPLTTDTGYNLLSADNSTTTGLKYTINTTNQ